MHIPVWFRHLHRRLFAPHASAATHRSVRLHLESLEERITPTTFNPANAVPLTNAPALGQATVTMQSLSSTPPTLSGGEGNPTPTPTPPTLSQALVSLYLDGASMEATNLFYEFVHGDDFNIDNFYGSPSQLAVVQTNAAAAGIDYDTVMSLESFLETLRNPVTVQNDIRANVPYAGPFAEAAVMAGEQAVLQASQLPPPASHSCDS